MKRNKVSILFYFMVALMMAAIFYFQGPLIVSTLSKTKLSLTILLIVLNIPYIALGGLAFDVLCRLYSIHLRWQDWFGLSFIANFMNQLLPYRPGMGFRYVYLKQHYNMKLSEFTFIMIGYFLIMLMSGIAFTASGWLIPGLPVAFYKTLTLCLGVAIGLILILVLLKRLPLLRTVALFINNPNTLLISCFCLLVMHLLGALMLFISFKALAFSSPFLHCIFLTGLLSIAMIIPVTPGNIGVMEALMGSLTQIMYNDFTLGFSTMALFRASQWVTSSFFGVVFSLKLVGRIFPRLSPSIKLGDNADVD